MATERRLKALNSFLKKQISKIILEQERPSNKIFTTVTKVETSSNLVESKVYLSVWPDEQSPVIMTLLKRDIKNIQKQIDKILPIRTVPKIVFIEDKGQKKAAKVEKIINELDKKAT